MALYDKLTKQNQKQRPARITKFKLNRHRSEVIKLIEFTSPILLSEHPDTQLLIS